jgi:hypothetical protein
LAAAVAALVVAFRPEMWAKPARPAVPPVRRREWPKEEAEQAAQAPRVPRARQAPMEQTCAQAPVAVAAPATRRGQAVLVV